MPSAYHVQREAVASLAAQPANGEQEYQPRPRLIAGDVCVGCIVWLPPQASHEQSIFCNKDICCGRGVLQKDGYDHPVVVLSIRQRENSTASGGIICSVACLTTFKNTSLPIYLERRLRKRHYKTSLPIIEADAVLENVNLLSVRKLMLEDGNLKKQSYVRLDHTYNAHVSILEQYKWKHCRAYKMRLSNLSYNDLMAELGLTPEPFEETGTLYETANHRLSALASFARHARNATAIRAVAELPPRSEIQPIYQNFTTHVSRSAFPAACYGTISSAPTTRYIPLPQSYTQTDYNAPGPSSESSDEYSFSFFFKCFLGVLVIGSYVWWRSS